MMTMTTSTPPPQNPAATPSPPARPDLDRLGEITLRPDRQAMLDRAADNGNHENIRRD